MNVTSSSAGTRLDQRCSHNSGRSEVEARSDSATAKRSQRGGEPHLLITAGHVIVDPEAEEVYSPGWLSVRGSRVHEVGLGAPPLSSSPTTKLISVPHGIVSPGLVNAHTHLSQSMMRAAGFGRSLSSWLQNEVRPLSAAMTPQDMSTAAFLGLVENLRSGITGVVQHQKLVSHPEYLDAVIDAAEKLGIRMLLVRGWRDRGEGRERREDIMKDVRRLLGAAQSVSSGRIRVGLGPKATWRCSATALYELHEEARALGIPTHIHVAETEQGLRQILAETGCREVEWLANLGVLDCHTHLVHCVWLTDHELDLVADSGAVVVHCPVSNLYLGSGSARTPAMLDRSIPICLGADGAASSGNQNLFEVMKASLTSARSLAAGFTPVEAVKAATTNGSLALGRSDLGKLRPGFKADIAVFDLDTPETTPYFSPLDAMALTLSPANVHSVIVDGEILIDKGQLLSVSIGRLLEDSRQAFTALVRRAGLPSTKSPSRGLALR